MVYPSSSQLVMRTLGMNTVAATGLLEIPSPPAVSLGGAGRPGPGRAVGMKLLI